MNLGNSGSLRTGRGTSEAASSDAHDAHRVARDAHRVAVRFSGVDFAHREAEVLKNASFHVHEGEFVALIGPNGSGKTTILRLILGLASPGAGSIEVFGAPPELARGAVGYVPQSMSFDRAFPISVEEVVRMGRLSGAGRGCLKGGCSDVDDALEMADVADLRDRPYAALSGGQRRRVLVARALASKPRLLVLDEPTANMDEESERRLYAVLGSLKGSATVIIATHDTDFVSALTDVVLCVNGRSGDEAPGGVARHASGPVERVSSGHYGGAILQVLHDTDLPDDARCVSCADGTAETAAPASAGAAPGSSPAEPQGGER
ncbi:metal ABC transporter ATP-binding protein [bacterium]|nr:metal ABC transporter ATP-binding protein [bacterium]